MKKRYQIDKQCAVQKFRRLATEVNPTIQMMLPMAGIVGLLQEGVGHLMREAGLMLMMGVMDEEVRHVVGERHAPNAERQASRWVKRRATALSTGRKFLSRGHGCGIRITARCGWGAMSCSSVAGRCRQRFGTR